MKTKCPACKFDNCATEFKLHPSNTSFSSLELQFQKVSEGLKEENVQEWVKTFCPAHTMIGGAWMDTVWECYDKLRQGVLLTKIGKR